MLLRITAAGLKALGIEPEAAQSAEAPQRPGAGHTDSLASAASLSVAAAEGPSASHPAPRRGKTREGTKQAALIAMLQRSEGATIAEVVKAIELRTPVQRRPGEIFMFADPRLRGASGSATLPGRSSEEDHAGLGAAQRGARLLDRRHRRPGSGAIAFEATLGKLAAGTPLPR